MEGTRSAVLYVQERRRERNEFFVRTDTATGCQPESLKLGEKRSEKYANVRAAEKERAFWVANLARREKVNETIPWCFCRVTFESNRRLHPQILSCRSNIYARSLKVEVRRWCFDLLHPTHSLCKSLLRCCAGWHLSRPTKGSNIKHLFYIVWHSQWGSCWAQ